MRSVNARRWKLLNAPNVAESTLLWMTVGFWRLVTSLKPARRAHCNPNSVNVFFGVNIDEVIGKSRPILRPDQFLLLISDQSVQISGYDGECAARITSIKPNHPRRQLAVMTPPINAPMMPSKATSLPVK